jgi:gas vesicle protein
VNKKGRNMSRFINFMSGLIVGGLVGAGLAILFTPDSGKNLRNQIQRTAEDIEEEVRQASHEKRIELERQLETLRTPYSNPGK